MPGCRCTRRYYSLAQARQMILDDSDVEVDNVVVIPPENKGDVTDDEENDEGSAMPVDVPGEVEVDYIATESSADNSSSSESESHASTSAKKRRQQTKTRTCRETKSRISKSEETEECDKSTTNKMPQRKQETKKTGTKKPRMSEWKETEEYDTALAQKHITTLSDCTDGLEDKTPYDLFKLFYTENMNQHLVNQSMTYATQRNDHSFEVNEDDMAKFAGIHLLSGYRSLPRQRLYWSSDEDVCTPLVSNAMTRNRFESIKRNLHLADNAQLNVADRAAKVRPLYDILNNNLKQFGVFKRHLSIDEQMLPYFGKHSAKMFMRNKPVKFGYKFWVLASATGFPFHILLYTGKQADASDGQPLGSQVVKQLLTVVDEPTCHSVTFDNFFTSLELLKALREQGLSATGTIRENRLRDCTIEKSATTKKDERGTFYYRGDGNVVVTSWKDNKTVYVASNNVGVKPTVSKRRYSRAEKKHIQVSCPQMIDVYNRTMGGVDLLDRSLSEYRPSIRGKKWWYCFYTHAVNICAVAAWRVHVEVGGKLDQLEFFRYIVRSLLQATFVSTPVPKRILPDVRYDGKDHIMTKAASQGRCKLEGCRSHTWYQCGKCDQRLHQKCFVLFHLPKHD